jgi:hypothetical protein
MNGIHRQRKSETWARARQIHKRYVGPSTSRTRAATTQSRVKIAKGCELRGRRRNNSDDLVIGRRRQDSCGAVKNRGDGMIKLFCRLAAGGAVRMGGMRRRRGDGFDVALKDGGRRRVNGGW